MIYTIFCIYTPIFYHLNTLIVSTFRRLRNSCTKSLFHCILIDVKLTDTLYVTMMLYLIFILCLAQHLNRTDGMCVTEVVNQTCILYVTINMFQTNDCFVFSAWNDSYGLYVCNRSNVSN